MVGQLGITTTTGSYPPMKKLEVYNKCELTCEGGHRTSWRTTFLRYFNHLIEKEPLAFVIKCFFSPSVQIQESSIDSCDYSLL